jgi:(p)ppGpp synthase/HD superfamily hydrolase
MKQDYEKMKISIRSWMLGRGYYNAVKAMNFAEALHNGVRKDGAPEFSHQVSQACYARTMIDSLLYPEETLCLIFLHDTVEDKGVTREQLVKLFGERVANAVIKISKVVNGLRIPDEIYYKGMEDCPISSAGKGLDRVHNLMTMLGGFKPEKQKSYIVETMEKVIPLLKVVRKAFPEQECFYENIKFVMTNQIQLYNALHKALQLVDTK